MSTDFPKPEKKLFETKLTDVEATDIEGAGVIRKDIAGNVYRWVKNGDTTGSTATVNGASCYVGADRTQVKRPATAELANFAGVWQAAVPNAQYGWILCQGVGTGLISNSHTSNSVSNYVGAWLPQNGSYLLLDAANSLAAGVGYAKNSASLVSGATASVTLMINAKL